MYQIGVVNRDSQLGQINLFTQSETLNDNFNKNLPNWGTMGVDPAYQEKSTYETYLDKFTSSNDSGERVPLMWE